MVSGERIYALYKNRILAFFIARRIERDKGEDLTQDVFFRYHKSNYNFEEKVAKAILFRIAHNIFIDYIRSEKNSESVVYTNQNDCETDVDYISEIVDETVDTPTTIDAQRQLKSVITQIESLPPKCRDVFIDFRFRNLSQSEIAKKRKISISMVEKHVATAIRRLKVEKPAGK